MMYLMGLQMLSLMQNEQPISICSLQGSKSDSRYGTDGM